MGIRTFQMGPAGLAYTRPGPDSSPRTWPRQRVESRQQAGDPWNPTCGEAMFENEKNV